MRKWYMVVISLMAAVAVLVMLGCEGDAGSKGLIGLQGPQGDSGRDLTKLPPAGRPIAVGVTNGTFDAVNGVKSLWMTFDSTARGRPDTLAAVRVSTPPLIDGVDGGDAEWGQNTSRLRLTFLNPDPNAQDPNVYDLVMKAAYDDENVYLFLQWGETKVTIRTPDGRDSTLVDAGDSKSPREIYFDQTAKIIESIDTVDQGTGGSEPIIDTTFFQWVRVDTLSADTLICLPNPDTPDPTDTICYLANVVADTTLLWRTWRQGEDRLVVFFDGEENPVANWADLAFADFFDFPGGANLPANYMVDVWSWGAGTSDPVFIADDWVITSNGKEPDVGKAPYISNYLMPDSIPLYMYYLDPNYKSALNLNVDLFPFWYYDAVGYSTSDWFSNRSVFIAGYVTTIPNGSRADVYAAASFDTPSKWTLEMKRARNTNNGDDVQF